MHSILTYKMDNSRMGCINRDKMDAKHPKIVRFIYGERRNSFEVSERLQSQQDANHHQSNSIMLRAIPWWIYMRLDKYN
jgi:hypothetical protein